MEINKIYLGDCLEIIPSFPAQSIDLLVCSPPFFNSNKKYQRGSGVHYSFDVGEPLYTIEDMFAISKPVIKSDGFLAINLGFSYGETGVLRPFYIISRAIKYGWFVFDHIIWKKKNPIPLNGRLTNCFENIFILSHHPHAQFPNAEKMKYILNFIETSINKPAEASFHSAVFPKEISSFVIEIFSKVGDLVLDPFMGSGTTALSAIDLGRNYIGIDINPDYVEKSTARIKEYIKSEKINSQNSLSNFVNF